MLLVACLLACCLLSCVVGVYMCVYVSSARFIRSLIYPYKLIWCYSSRYDMGVFSFKLNGACVELWMMMMMTRLMMMMMMTPRPHHPPTHPPNKRS